jgi:hypothetical protein
LLPAWTFEASKRPGITPGITPPKRAYGRTVGRLRRSETLTRLLGSPTDPERALRIARFFRASTATTATVGVVLVGGSAYGSGGTIIV